MKVTVYNPEVEELETTYLNNAVTQAATILKVKNSNGFNNTRKVLVGRPGRERSEMVTQSNKTTTQLTVGATAFNHDAGDPVYALDYDQVKIYRSTTGPNGSYSLLTTLDVDWDNDDNQTKYNDVNALSSYYYKFSYYDSIAAVESDKTDALQATGYPRNSVGGLIMSEASRYNDQQFGVLSIEDMIDIMNDVNDDLITRAKKPYRFLKVAESIDVSAGDTSFPYPTDLSSIDYVEANQVSIAYPRGPKEVTPIDMRYRQRFNTGPATWVSHIAYDDENEAVMFNPAAQYDRIGAFTLHYYRSFKDYVSLSDTVVTPNTLVYRLALRRERYLAMADSDSKYLAKAKDYDNRYETEVIKLQKTKNIKADGPKSLHPDIKRYRQ